LPSARTRPKVPRRENTPPEYELTSYLGDAPAEMSRCRKIGLRWSHIRSLVNVRLSAGAEPKTQPIEIGRRAARGIVGRRQREVDPVHAVLSREQRDLDQGGELVACVGAGIGEAGRNLVSPEKAFGHDRVRGRVLEGFEPC